MSDLELAADETWVCPMTAEQLDEALNAVGMTPAERLGVEVVAAMKADLFGNEFGGKEKHLQSSRYLEVLMCLNLNDPELEAEVSSGGFSRQRADAYLQRERNALLVQAGFVGQAVSEAWTRLQAIEAGRGRTEMDSALKSLGEQLEGGRLDGPRPAEALWIRRTQAELERLRAEVSSLRDRQGAD